MPGLPHRLPGLSLPAALAIEMGMSLVAVGMTRAMVMHLRHPDVLPPEFCHGLPKSPSTT